EAEEMESSKMKAVERYNYLAKDFVIREVNKEVREISAGIREKGYTIYPQMYKSKEHGNMVVFPGPHFNIFLGQFLRGYTEMKKHPEQDHTHIIETMKAVVEWEK